MQKLLSEKVDKQGAPRELRKVVGLDVSYVDNTGFAVATLLNYPQLSLTEYVVVRGSVNIPYIPGLLAFREAPLMIKAYEKLGSDADLIIVDGHGVTHPRGLGIASHIGIVVDRPTIGAAKRLLCGDLIKAQDAEYIVVNKEIGGIALSFGSKKIYLSIGHKVSIDYIKLIAPKLFKDHYLPEPTYIADVISKRVRRGFNGEN